MRYHVQVNNAHRKTLVAVYARPTRADIRWKDIESLVLAAGGGVYERAGSRVAMELNGVVAVFHRPHPKPVTNKGAVDALRRFLDMAGVRP